MIVHVFSGSAGAKLVPKEKFNSNWLCHGSKRHCPQNNTASCKPFFKVA